MNKHIKIQISGKVQGVWFRDSVRNAANKLELVGYVKNNNDGTVITEACGDEKRFKEFVNLCRQGSKSSDVKGVDYIIDNEVYNYDNFEIL